jgi:hypothetical protein
MRAYARLLLVFTLACSACGPTIDLTKGLQVEVLKSGWFDAGIINGQSKLVPTVTISLKNVSDQKLVTLQLNALFRQASAQEEWGSAFMTAAGSEGLAAGASIGPLTLKSQNGYTGSDQTRLEMLQNSHFVDAKVQLFAKYGPTQWAKMGEYPITRQLLEK